jgi:hypothetical protein
MTRGMRLSSAAVPAFDQHPLTSPRLAHANGQSNCRLVSRSRAEAQLLRSGRLTSALRQVGFGVVDETGQPDQNPAVKGAAPRLIRSKPAPAARKPAREAPTDDQLLRQRANGPAVGSGSTTSAPNHPPTRRVSWRCTVG